LVTLMACLTVSIRSWTGMLLSVVGAVLSGVGKGAFGGCLLR
jgi:hypothetical protein